MKHPALKGRASARMARAVAWAVAGSLLAWALGWADPFNLGDEGFRFLLARSWARGENLFAHYRLLYLPGEYAWFGGWLVAFGEHLRVLRLANAVLLGLASGLLYHAARGWLPAGWRGELPASALALAVALTVPPEPKVLAMALVIALALPLFETSAPSARCALAAAAAAGFLGGVREDSAVLALLVAVAVLARRRQPREALTHLLPGLALGIAPWVVLFVLRGELAPFLDHLAHRYTFLAARLGEPTEVGGPGLREVLRPGELVAGQTLDDPRIWRRLLRPVVVLLPLLLYSGLLARAGWGWWRSRGGWRELSPALQASLAAAVIGLAYLPQFLWERPDLAHFRTHLPAFLLALVLVGAGDDREGQHRVGTQREGAATGSRRGWRALAVSSLLVGLALSAVSFRALRHRAEPPLPYPTPFARAIGARLAGEPPSWAGLRSRAEATPLGETLIALGWGAGWTVLEGLEPGSRHLSTFPRHVGDAASLAELRGDLIRPTNRWVILGAAEVPEPILEVLHAHYQHRDTWRGWQLWEQWQP